LPTVPPVREVVVIENGTETVIKRLAEAVLAGLLESVTSTVRPEIPELTGVPVIAPLEALRLRPAGSEPETIAQV
jgi:hypothetical protein